MVETRVISTSVRLGRTISLGNYEFLRLDIEETFALKENESVSNVQEEARHDLHIKLKALAKEELAAIGRD